MLAQAGDRRRACPVRVDEYAALDATGLAAIIAAGEVSVPEVVEVAREAVAAVEPALGAVVELYPDAGPDPTTPGAGPGPFEGVPFLVKDMGAHFAGRLLEFGSRLARGHRVAADSHYGTSVRDAGVVLLGRTNTPEFSMAMAAENRLHGRTTNPWRDGYGTGGSSGGAAAAVAAGIAPVAHTSDIGGSTRGPASWCGTVGLQPSRGRVSAGPARAEGGSGMAQVFVTTRTVRDTARWLDVLGRPRPGDPFVVARPSIPWAAFAERTAPGRRLRIAWSAAPLMDAPVDAEIAAAVQKTAAVLAAAGHEVEEAAPRVDLAALDRTCLAAWYFRFDRTIDELAVACGRSVGPETLERATLRFYAYARASTADTYIDALAALNEPRRTVGGFLERYDAWLTPTCAQVAAPHGTYSMDVDLEPEAFLAREQEPCQYLVLSNVTGMPAISLPLAMHTSGLPIGVQLLARHAEEDVLLELGAQLEAAMPWRDRQPQAWAGRVVGA
jgi:amidase